MPARQAVRVSWTVAVGLCRASVTWGSAGRYMSMDSGGSAVRPPRTRVTSRPVRRAASRLAAVLTVGASVVIFVVALGPASRTALSM